MTPALQVIAWYAVLAAIGLAMMLPAALLCDRLHTRGVLYARPLAITTVAMAAWLLSSFGVPYGTPLVIGCTLALVAWSASIAWRRPDVLREVIARRGIILAGEALCLVAFTLVLLARMQAPDANATEKPMDIMVLTAVHRAASMPPPDPWLSGETLSYYHLGHLGMDVLGRLSGASLGIVFNLATATAGALAALAVAGVAIDAVALGRPGATVRRGALLVAGGAAVAMLLLVTPVAGIANIAAANGLGDPAAWAALGVEGVPPPEIGAVGGVPTAFWWWWPTTRILPGTINEFPAFTLLLGDPHAHLLALPLDLVAVALALAIFEGGEPLTWRRWAMRPERLLLTAIVFAGIVMTNTWDIAITGGLWGAAAIVAFLRTGWSLAPTLIGVSRWAVAPIGLALALAWGFINALDTPSLGLALVTGEHSDPTRWLLVWLPLLLLALVAIATLRPALDRRALVPAAAIAVLSIASWLGALLGRGPASELVARGTGWVVIGGLAIAITLAIAAAIHADGRVDRGLGAALALLGAALLVLLALELFRISDAFPGRFNTVFKFGFNAWALLAVAGGALAGLAWERGLPAGRRVTAVALRLGTAVAVTAVLATALFVPAMAASRGTEGQLPGLDGVMHLQRDDPGLYATIEWARDHLDPAHDVVAQAVAESYTGGNRLAAVSGVPTLLGWPNHERQWRRRVPEADRRAVVDAIYSEGAVPATADLARRFRVTYVYIGREERAAYGPDVAVRFAGWPVAVDADGALLVRVP